MTKVLKFLFIATLPLLAIFIASPKNISAQATEDCQLTAVIYNGNTVTINGTTSVSDPNIDIPENTQFSLQVSCIVGFPTPTDVTVSVGGLSNTQTGLTSVVNKQFGPYSGLDASSVTAGSVKSFPLVVTIPGQTVTCSASSWQCNVEILNTAPVGSPVATPLPVPGSETSLIKVEGSGCNNLLPCTLQTITLPGGTTNYTFAGLIPDTSYDVYVSVAGTPQPSFNPKKCTTDDTGSLAIDWLAGSCGTGKPGITSGTLVPGQNPCTGNACVTGLGTIPTTVQGFATTILGIAAGIGGGIALILMVMGAVQVLTSSGDQQKLNGGRERIVAALAGLLFIIFAVLILQFIGISILGGIPGFS